MSSSLIGASVPRLRDLELIEGRGRFIDDLHPSGLVEAHILRSPHASARIRGINLTAARALPKVIAVWAYDDLSGLDTDMPMIIPDRRIRHPKCPTILARDRARYVGQPVAIVIAESRYIAEDAAELIAVDYGPLPAVGALRSAIDGSRLVHEDAERNIAGADRIATGDADAAIARAPHVIWERFELTRGHAQPLEPRAIVARFDKETRQLTVWDLTQAPIPLRAKLSKILRLDASRLRVIAPDIGGGFGPKMAFYAEEVLIPYAAMRLGRPVKWIEDRMESFVATASEREQYP